MLKFIFGKVVFLVICCIVFYSNLFVFIILLFKINCLGLIKLVILLIFIFNV